MEKQKRFFVLIFLSLLFSSCRIIEYSPNQVISSTSRSNLTQTNLDKLMKQVPGDTIQIVHFGDTHHFYKDLKDLVISVNNLEGIDFLVNAGDMTDYGLLQGYEWSTDIFDSFRYPYFTSVGNHDKVANGELVYKTMFGDLNYYFTYGKFRFVFIDTNPDMFRFDGSIPDLTWLSYALADTNNYVNAIVVFHIPPYHADFDETLSSLFCEQLKQNKKILLCMYGHTHHFATGTICSEVPFYCSTTPNQRVYWTYKIWPGGFHADTTKF